MEVQEREASCAVAREGTIVGAGKAAHGRQPLPCQDPAAPLRSPRGLPYDDLGSDDLQALSYTPLCYSPRSSETEVGSHPLERQPRYCGLRLYMQSRQRSAAMVAKQSARREVGREHDMPRRSGRDRAVDHMARREVAESRTALTELLTVMPAIGTHAATPTPRDTPKGEPKEGFYSKSPVTSPLPGTTPRRQVHEPWLEAFLQEAQRGIPVEYLRQTGRPPGHQEKQDVSEGGDAEEDSHSHNGVVKHDDTGQVPVNATFFIDPTGEPKIRLSVTAKKGCGEREQEQDVCVHLWAVRRVVLSPPEADRRCASSLTPEQRQRVVVLETDNEAAWIFERTESLAVRLAQGINVLKAHFEKANVLDRDFEPRLEKIIETDLANGPSTGWQPGTGRSGCKTAALRVETV